MAQVLKFAWEEFLGGFFAFFRPFKWAYDTGLFGPRKRELTEPVPSGSTSPASESEAASASSGPFCASVEGGSGLLNWPTFDLFPGEKVAAAPEPISPGPLRFGSPVAAKPFSFLDGDLSSLEVPTSIESRQGEKRAPITEKLHLELSSSPLQDRSPVLIRKVVTPDKNLDELEERFSEVIKFLSQRHSSKGGPAEEDDDIPEILKRLQKIESRMSVVDRGFSRYSSYQPKKEAEPARVEEENETY